MPLRLTACLVTLGLMTGCGSSQKADDPPPEQQPVDETNPAKQRKCTGCGELIADRKLKECPSCEAPLGIWGKDVEGE